MLLTMSSPLNCSARRQNSIGDGKGVPVDCDIMYAEDRSALKAQNGARRGGSRIPVRGFPLRNRADEPLARCSDKQRQTETVEFVEPRHQLQIFLRAFLGKTEAGVENDVFPRDAGCIGDLQRFSKECELVVDDVGELLA